MNKKYVIITSINPPTEAVIEFSKWLGWTTVVVGDRKSPPDWECEKVVYLSIDEQIDKFAGFAGFLPENTYVRKMIGYLYAFENGAEAIFESDDDNIPYSFSRDTVEADLKNLDNWSPALNNKSGWINIYKEFGSNGSWPRGYPLEYIIHSVGLTEKLNTEMHCGVVQYLADEDPDVDAIYRLTVGDEVFFEKNKRLCVNFNTYTPFNSQATLWGREMFPLMFLPIGIKDRVTDILRGYIALACMWKYGKTLGVSSPVVYQRRNEHNLINDFRGEMDLYLNANVWRAKLLDLPPEATLAETYLSAIKMFVDIGVMPKSNLDAYQLFTKHLEL